MKKDDVKIIAYYLPQFHETKENNEFWGEGYTEWTNVKKAKPIYKGHNQPRIPINNDYYDLLDGTKIISHMNLARKYGIYGFCFYHYWFGNHRQILNKPVDALLNLDITLPFCFCWANETWTRTWNGGGGDKEILMNQVYCGEKAWIDHIKYLLEFFKNEKYIKIDDKPVLLIFDPQNIPLIIRDKMFELWNRYLVKNGFQGLELVMVDVGFRDDISSKYSSSKVDFEPTKNRRESELENSIYNDLRKFFWKYQNNNLIGRFIHQKISYVDTCKKIVEKEHYLGYYRSFFVGYDDTPRRGNRATIYEGTTPQNYQYYLKKQLRLSYKEKNDYLFLYAWNEWGEGGYLEPDVKNGTAYLEATKQAMETYND